MKNDFISVFWAWNSDLNKDIIKSQLTDFASKGITDVFAHARAGLKVEYMGKEWLDAFSYALEVAKEVGVKVWIYDENGWPSGFGGGKVYEKDESFKQRYLVKETLTAKEFLSKGILETDVIGVYSVLDGKKIKRVKIKKALSSKEKFDFIYVVKNDYYVDITNPDAIDYFIETTHEVYKQKFSEYFGNVIPGVFTDEPHVSPNGMPFGRFIVEGYENTYKEKFINAVENVFFDLDGCEKYRLRFNKIITKLIHANYVKKCNDWCNKNNLLFTGHFANEEGLASQVGATGSVMNYYTDMGLIGTDALGNRLIPVIAYKQASSVSKQFGSGKVICETYAGTGYDSSFRELLRIWAFQAVHGITHLCASISMMSIEGNRKRDYPQFFSEQFPWWEKADELFHRIKFINSNIGSKSLTDVLVIHSMSGAYMLYGNETDDRVLSHTTSLRNLTEALLSSQVDFDFGAEEHVGDKAVIKNGRFILGNCEYKTVIVAENPNLDSKVLDKLKAFANSGGKVIFAGKLPQYLDGEKTAIKLDFDFDKIAIRADYIRKYVQAYMMPEICIMEPMERRLSNLFEVCKKQEGNAIRFTVLNKSRSQTAVGRLIVKGKKTVKEISKDGEEVLLGVYDSVNNVSEFNLSLNGLSYAIFDIQDGEPNNEKIQKIAETAVSLTKITSSFNTFTIDKASIKINNDDFDEPEYALNKTGKLFATINGKGESNVKVKYNFNVKGKLGKVFVSAEMGTGVAFINGERLDKKLCAFYKDATKYDITDFVKDGENEFIIQIDLPPYVNSMLGKEVFQSVMNVFSFPYYVEPIYLEGEFSVDSEITSLSTHVVSKPEFTLVKARKIKGGDLTAQGMPFFNGKITAEYKIKSDLFGDKTLIKAGENFASYAEMEINGKIYSLVNDKEVDITSSLEKGKDAKITLTLYSNSRNIFGPFHHVYGKHYYTGPSVFEGYAEWQDAVIYPELKGNTYIDGYSFTHFCVPTLSVLTIKREK